MSFSQIFWYQKFRLRPAFADGASKPLYSSAIQRPGSSDLINYLNRVDSGGLGEDASDPLPERRQSTALNVPARLGSSQSSSTSQDASRDIVSTTSDGLARPLSPTPLSDPSQRDNGSPSPGSRRSLGSVDVPAAQAAGESASPTTTPDGTDNSQAGVDSSRHPAAQALSHNKEVGMGASAGGASQKKAKMGREEIKARNQSNAEKHNNLMNAINTATAVYEEKLEEIAKENNVKVQRVKQLALHAPPISRKRKVSDWNIMVHFKGKELNDGELSVGGV